MRYRESVGTTSQPATLPIETLHHLYASSNAETYNLARSEFDEICAEQAEYLAALSPRYRNDYILAQACAHGHNQAWEHFLALYRQPLTRAAIAITNDPSLGQDLADALYAELYGLTTKPQNDDSGTPIRKSPLSSYKGRGSLIGWLRTTLAQRHVDHHRKTWREESLDNSANAENPDQPNRIEPIAPTPEAIPTAKDLTIITLAVQQSLANRPAEDRFLLAAYFLDQQTLLQISRVLHVHEATVSRKLHRLVEDLRKDLLANLQSQGLSKRAAEEALGTDPRDLTTGDPDPLSSNLRNLLQISQSQPFPEKAGQ
jgi:RNA polymerase sigma-70 factor, ECF subfamily